jgi:hypothetical protein
MNTATAEAIMRDGASLDVPPEADAAAVKAALAPAAAAPVPAAKAPAH